MDVEYIDSEFEELIPAFLENKKMELEVLRTLCVQKDFVKLVFMGHRIRGSAENYGFRFISEMGRLLEFHAGKEDLEAILQLLESFEGYLKAVTIQYVEL